MAALRELLTCAECSKQKREIKKYPRNQIVNFKSRNLCPSCYQQALANEKFNTFICELFGIKSPGPKIYAQRKRLREEYGYTDATIMKTLDYLFNVEKKNKSFESLGLVNPKNVEEAIKYYQKKEYELEQMKEAAKQNQEIRTAIVPMKKKQKEKKKINLDEINWDD